MTSPNQNRTVISVALGLALAVVVVGGIGFQRKLETFRNPGILLQEGAGSQATIESVEGTAAENLRAGDQILLVNNTTVSAVSLRSALRESALSELVVLRNGEVITLELERPPLRIDYSYLVQAFIGALYLLIGLYTILRQQGRQSRLFFLWCLVSVAFYILVSTPSAELVIDTLGKSIYWIEEIARLLLPPLTLHFFLTFPKQLADSRRARRLVPFLYLPAAVQATLLGDLIVNRGRLFLGGPDGEGIGVAIGLLDRLEILLFVAFAAAAGGLLLYQSAHGTDKEERRQLLWIALGMGAGYTPFLLLYGVPWSLGLQGPVLFEVLAVLPLAIVPLTFAYAILRYRLWDITIIARDVATYTLTLLFGILGFSVLRLAVDAGLPPGAEVSRNLLTLAAALLVGGLLVPTRQKIGSTLERAYYRSGFNKRRALADLGKELLAERDLEQLCRVLLDQLEEGLGIERTNLFLAEGETLRPVHDEDPSIRELPLEAFSDAFWSAELEPLSGIALPGAPAPPAQLLFRCGYRYAFPLRVRDRRLGFLAASYRVGETPLSSEDQDLVRQLLNQAALAIENAYLLDQLQHQLAEVQELKHYSEGIIEASPAGIAVLDGEDRIVSANLAFSALVGVEQGATRRRPLAEVLTIDELPAADGGTVEISVKDAQDRTRELQISVAAFSTRSSRDLRVLIVSDVTARVAMERDLEEKGRLAALGVMAAGIAHEVNTPLTGISSYAQMLLADTEPEDPRYEVLKKVERQTFRASRIVNNLLSLARSGALKPQPIELRLVLNECTDLLREVLESSSVELSSTVDEGLFVDACEGELEQVFSNLLSNAVEAMDSRGGTLRISAATVGSNVEVIVEDTGPGIPEHLRSKVFEPFYSTKRDRGGTGLGLSISAEIVRRNDGELTIEEPKDGIGARFLVRLRSSSAGD